MTDAQKLTAIKTLLGGDSADLPSDDTIQLYITLSASEILAWKYHLIGGVPDDVDGIPDTDENAQIFAVIAGYTHAGAEGETQHIENGVHRTFLYEDMVGYIRNHVLPYVRVGAVR